MRHILTFLIITTLCGSGIAQPTKWWHIGQNIKFDATIDPPVPTLGGCLNNLEGVAAISDNAGNFLFATDGLTIYDRNCNPMPNGTGLLGGNSSTQSGIIVPNPANPNVYYVFTCSQDAGGSGICYSEVNMSLNAGLGNVTAVKNVNLTPFVMSEKLTAVSHCNNVDIWVVAKRYNDAGFRSWLVTVAGVNPVPVISVAGYSPTGTTQTAYGQLKANPQGNKLLAAYYGLTANANGHRAEVYDFDNSTGVVSNAVSLGTITGAYGAEWSPDGTIAYVGTNPGVLFQYNTCTGIRTQIASVGPFFGSLQLTPQGKILIGKGSATRLACIQNPNNLGLACNFTDNYITLPAQSRMGLPNFIPRYFNPPTPMFAYSQIDCDSYQFFAPTFPSGCGVASPPSLSWEYLGATSSETNPIVNFPSGSNTITLDIAYPCYTETQTLTINTTSISGMISAW